MVQGVLRAQEFLTLTTVRWQSLQSAGWWPDPIRLPWLELTCRCCLLQMVDCGLGWYPFWSTPCCVWYRSREERKHTQHATMMVLLPLGSKYRYALGQSCIVRKDEKAALLMVLVTDVGPGTCRLGGFLGVSLLHATRMPVL